ncbi:TonB family protein [Pseudoduganella sp. FT26W]|uniref:TonB family protein n=1 Tax=Duganella aquatilis TaxID=2666082 RepID=A0A844D6C9_9BURK|nr:energy transducer TonB [Duganella aquatilis]MRW83070.1 TonB family protein [Duganella aquatilis]
MNMKISGIAAVIAVLAAINFVGRSGQSAPRGAPFKDLVSAASCAQPQWPAEARRYEIEGKTTLQFEIGQDGKVLRPAVTRGSGWRILDEAALAGIAQCVFRPNLEAARAGQVFPLQYVWKLSGAPAERPLLVTGSCQPSARFGAFREADPHPSGADGILLRFLVNAEGAPVRIVAEPDGQPPALADEAVAYLQSCRFAYDSKHTGERTDTGFGRVLLK